MLKNLLLFMISIFIAFLIGEACLRIFLPAANIEQLPKGLHLPDKILGSRMAKNFNGIHKQEEFRVSINTSSLGIRYRELSEKNKGVFRIACLGDSFAFGFGVEVKQTYSALLEKDLNSGTTDINKKLKYEVINTATVGWGTIDEFNFLKENEAFIKPDLVILLFFVGNDFWDNLNSIERIKEGYQAEKFTPLSPIREFLQKHVRLYDFLFKIISKERRISNFLFNTGLRRVQTDLYTNIPSNKYLQGLKLTEKTLLDLKKYLSSHNASFALVIIPEDIQVLYPKALDRKGFTVNKPQMDLMKFCKNNDIDALDLLPLLSGLLSPEKIYFLKDSHLNSFGYELISRHTKEFLIRGHLIP